MNDPTSDDELPADERRATEALLRASLAARADSVEPADPEAAVGAALASAGTTGRRRRLVFSAAAAVVVIAVVAAAVALGGDDDPGETELATGPSTTLAGPPLAPGEVAIWPLAASSRTFDDPVDVATSFFNDYVGIDGSCSTGLPGTSSDVFEVQCGPSDGSTTLVHVRQDGLAWVVTGAEATDGLDLVEPTLGSLVVNEFAVDVANPQRPSSTVDVRSVVDGVVVDSAEVPEGGGGATLRLPEGTVGQYVVVVSDGSQAEAIVIEVGTPEQVAEDAIWPLPTMSVAYDDPEAAAEAFLAGFAGIEGGGCQTAPAGEVAEVPCAAPCPVDVPCGDTTIVRVRHDPNGWVVLGSDSTAWSVANPAAGATVGADIAVEVLGVDLALTLRAEVRPIGTGPGSAPTVDTTTIPLDPDGGWHLVLGAADGPSVLLVTDGTTVTARRIVIDSVGVPSETTTTTTGPTDDGVPGWPGLTSRAFDDPQSAALAFADDVLDFADPTPGETADAGTDATIQVDNRPGGQATSLQLHDTGEARGWVVVGVTSTQGSIDGVSRDGENVSVTGQAIAFEATVNVRLVAVDGTVLGETTTSSGISGELGPFAAVVHQDLAFDGPVYVQVAEGDASGEGRFSWAAWALVDA